MARNEMQSLKLPADIIERVEARLPYTEFDSAGEYVGFVMEEVLYNVETEGSDDGFERVDEREVKDRLESLGYLEE